jgi:hypothetical protein
VRESVAFSLPELSPWLLRPSGRCDHVHLGASRPSVVATMSAAVATPNRPALRWVHASRKGCIMPTLLVDQRPLGRLFISALDPVLNRDWLEDNAVG